MTKDLNVITLSGTQFNKAKEVLTRLEDDETILNKNELEVMSLLKKYNLLTPEFLEDLDKL